jgi:hypothetical protein
MGGMFVHNEEQYANQAGINLIQIELHNIVDGQIRNIKKGEPIYKLYAVLSDEFKFKLASTWGEGNFHMKIPSAITGIIDSARKKVPIETEGGENFSGDNPKAYKAGPYSSQKYEGVQGYPSLNLNFTAYADTTLMTNVPLSRPLECFYWLLLTQVPKEGRGGLEAEFKQLTREVATTVSVGIQTFDKLTDRLADLCEGFSMDKAGEVLKTINPDMIMAQMNTNPGNWIARITVGNVISGWFVIDSVDATFSKERFWNSEPLYIKFALSVMSYMIPDKAGMSNGYNEIVRPYKEGEYNDINEFSKLYIMSYNDTKAMTEQKKQMDTIKPGVITN